MKNFTLIISYILIGMFAQAQVLPNPGFENWTAVGSYQNPNNWNNLNPNTSPLGVLTCLKATGADVHSGSSAIKLVTKSVLGQNANGIATTGTISIAPPGVSGGVSYSGRPDSIAGWYKYTSVGGDNGFVQLLLYGVTGTDTVGFIRFQTPASTVGTYTRFSAAIVYYNTNAVDKAQWLLSSSGGFTAVVNSTLFVDDLELITNNTNGIAPIEANFLTISPNPVTTELKIENFSAKLQFTLYNSIGEAIKTASLLKGNSVLDLSALANGIYYFSALDTEKNSVQKGKFILAH